MNEEYSPRGNLYSLTTVWSVVYLFQGEGYFVGCCLGLSQSVCLSWDSGAFEGKCVHLGSCANIVTTTRE